MRRFDPTTTIDPSKPDTPRTKNRGGGKKVRGTTKGRQVDRGGARLRLSHPIMHAIFFSGRGLRIDLPAFRRAADSLATATVLCSGRVGFGGVNRGGGIETSHSTLVDNICPEGLCG